MSEKNSRISRRNFLLTVGASGAATAAAVVAGKRAAPHATTGSGKRDGKGYHASTHVENYYRTTKV